MESLSENHQCGEILEATGGVSEVTQKLQTGRTVRHTNIWGTSRNSPKDCKGAREAAPREEEV